MNKTKSAKRDVEIFKDWFMGKYGVSPRIIYSFPTNKPRYSPEILRDIVNEVMSKYPFEYDAENATIDMKTREAGIVLYRNIYFYIGRDWGHTYQALGQALGCRKNHATVIHGIKKVTDQIELGDKLTINKLNTVINAIEEKLGTYGDVPQNHNQEFDPKSVLSPVLSTGEYSKPANKFASRHEGSNTDWIC